MRDAARFGGAFVALVALVVVGGVWLESAPVENDAPVYQPELFKFEKEDVVGITVVRPDRTISLVQRDGAWSVVGEPWKPSKSMVRRIAYQIHDLTARAIVQDGVTDFDAYGLGAGAITVELALKDGSTVRFAAGDPNPTSVSWYVRPLPGDTVYTVKKAALDYYSLSLEEFRERRFAWLDADAADAIDADIDGTHLHFDKTGDHAWAMTAPVAQRASLEQVRTMLGRTGALKAVTFVADPPADLGVYGLASPVARVRIVLGTSETVTLRVGSAIVGTDPPERYVYRDEDDAVYTAKDGFLDAFRLPITDYRDADILGRHPWDVRSVKVARGGDAIEIRHGKDDWRWPDDAPIPGSTPDRLASAASEAKAVGFHDVPVPEAHLDAPVAVVTLRFDDGDRVLTVGGPIGAAGHTAVTVDGDPTIYEVEPTLASAIDDLFREWARDTERRAGK